MLWRLAVAAAALPLCSAQCTLPAALPEDTAFAAGNPVECVLGAPSSPRLLAALCRPPLTIKVGCYHHHPPPLRRR